MDRIRIGTIQKKALILLAGGLSLGLSHNPRKQFRILKQMNREWDKVNDQSLKRAIRSLYESKLVDFKENADGSVKIVLSEDGHKKVLEYQLEEMTIKVPKNWDHKWRIIIFDIPEYLKKAREAIRFHLNMLGFYKLQKSVFILPYECKNEIEFLIEVYNLRPYVRQIVAKDIDNELHLKKIFKIS